MSFTSFRGGTWSGHTYIQGMPPLLDTKSDSSLRIWVFSYPLTKSLIFVKSVQLAIVGQIQGKDSPHPQGGHSVLETQPCEGVIEEEWKYTRGHARGSASSAWRRSGKVPQRRWSSNCVERWSELGEGGSWGHSSWREQHVQIQGKTGNQVISVGLKQRMLYRVMDGIREKNWRGL